MSECMTKISLKFQYYEALGFLWILFFSPPLVFNFLINFGIALLDPLVISIGMLFGMPLSAGEFSHWWILTRSKKEDRRGETEKSKNLLILSINF